MIKIGGNLEGKKGNIDRKIMSSEEAPGVGWVRKVGSAIHHSVFIFNSRRKAQKAMNPTRILNSQLSDKK